MNGQVLTLNGMDLLARASGALWWPTERLLCVADMHLAKSGRIARRGGTLLPPYETRETLDRLAEEIDLLTPTRVVCLGDSFDDDAGAASLDPHEAATLASLAAQRDWIWIAGNHDPARHALPGRCVTELSTGPLVFRHEAVPGTVTGEVSGHFHPGISLDLGGRRLRRACFLCDGARLILPAFGAYTGQLDSSHPAIAGLLSPNAVAVLTETPCLRVPAAAGLRRRAG